MKLVLASGNPGKLREIGEILADLDIELLSQSDFGIDSPPETATSFVGNALLKARHAAALSGLPAVADDSGLVVDALDGRPGIYSARFAGEGASDDDNLQRLFDELEGVAEEHRGAGFQCAAVLVYPHEAHAPLIAECTWRGRILEHRQGSGGFGYDPVFFDPVVGNTGAAMTASEKNAVSHRGRAFRELKDMMRKELRPR
jgi:XTP/dITP diphosphohydrolase